MDIKPANIFIDTKANVFKLGDFGCAWRKKDTSYNVHGGYLSPEARRLLLGEGDEFDHFKADVYSLGAILLQMAALKSPTILNSESATTDTVESLPCGEMLKSLLRQMLVLDPNNRPYMEDILKLVAQGDAPPEAGRTHPSFLVSKIPSVTPALSEDHQTLLPEGCQIDGYTQLQQLATMNSGRVSTAVSKDTGKPVVIKTYSCGSADYANELMFTAVTQVRVDHPKICKFLELKLQRVEDSGLAYYVHLMTEKLSFSLASDIERRVREDIPYSEEELFQFLQNVGEGLLYAQSKVRTTQNIAHLSIKPSNVFFENTENVFKVGDFGSTWHKIHRSFTEGDAGIYMSPEMKRAMSDRAAKFDLFASDEFALGVTLLHLATLSPPNPENLEGDIDSSRRSPSIMSLLKCMLLTAPEKRPTLQEIYNYAVQGSVSSDTTLASISQAQEQVAETELQPTSQETPTSYNKLAMIYLTQGILDKAELFILKALDIDPDFPDSLSSSVILLQRYEAEGRLDEAEQLALKLLEIRGTIHPDSPDLAEFYASLARIARAQGRLEETEEFTGADLYIREHYQEPNSSNLAALYHKLAMTYKAKGRYDQAEKFTLYALQIEETVLPPNSLELAASYHKLAMISLAQEKLDNAEKFIALALAIREQELPSESPLITTCNRDLAAIRKSKKTSS